MKKDLSGRLALDTSALIELVSSTKTGLKLKEALKTGAVEAHTTELNIAELTYIVCRRLDFSKANQIVDKLLASGYVKVEDVNPLIREAARYKCKRAISLADCFSLALAHELFTTAMFARKEQDLVAEMKKKPFDVEIIFLEDYE